MSDPEEALARDLVEADHEMLEKLVHIRKAVAKLTGSEVADRMGRHRSVVTNFEKLTADPHLSTIRRYAHAIGARITHIVEYVDPKGGGAAASEGDIPDTQSDPAPSSAPNVSFSDEELALIALMMAGRSGTQDASLDLIKEALVKLTSRTDLVVSPPAAFNVVVTRPDHLLIERRKRRVRLRPSSSIISDAVGTGL